MQADVSRQPAAQSQDPTTDPSYPIGIEIAILDIDGVIIAVNGPWTDFCEANDGNPVTTGIGVSYLDVCRRSVPAPGAAEVAEAIATALSGPVPTANRVVIECHAPHEERWFDILVLSRADEMGTIVGATVMLTQVPETHNDALLDDSALAAELLDACPDVVVMADEHGVVEAVNQPAERLFGCDRNKLLGRPIERLLPGSLADQLARGSRLNAMRQDGSEVPVEVSLNSRHVGGRQRVVASVRDIGERVRLERHTRLIDRCIDGVSDAIFVLDEHSLLFDHANHGAVEMFGYERAELVGSMNLSSLAPELSLHDVTGVLGELREVPGRHVRLASTGRARSGVEFPIEIQIDWPAPERPNEPRPVVAVARDMTETRA